MDMDTLLYLTWRTSKDLLSSTGNSAQYSVITLWSPGERMGEGIVREFGMDMDTMLYLTWRTNKELLDSTGNSAPCHVAAWTGGEFAGEGVHVYGRLSPPAVLLKASQHCSSPIQFSRLVVSDSLRPHGLQHARLPGPGYTPVRSKTLKIKRRLARSQRWAGVTCLPPTPGLRQ